MTLAVEVSRLVLFVVSAASAMSSLAHAREYTNVHGNATVDVTVLDVDDSWGKTEQKCIQFLEGAPETYTKACFTAIYSNTTELLNCVVIFDDTHQCDSCTICTTDDGQVGFENDCDLIELHSRVSTDGCV